LHEVAEAVHEIAEAVHGGAEAVHGGAEAVHEVPVRAHEGPDLARLVCGLVDEGQAAAHDLGQPVHEQDRARARAGVTSCTGKMSPCTRSIDLVRGRKARGQGSKSP
jgi:hypothetical protein